MHRDRWEPIAGLLKLVYETPVKGYEIIGNMMINQGFFEGFSRKCSDQNVGLDATWQFWGGWVSLGAASLLRPCDFGQFWTMPFDFSSSFRFSISWTARQTALVAEHTARHLKGLTRLTRLTWWPWHTAGRVTRRQLEETDWFWNGQVDILRYYIIL